MTIDYYSLLSFTDKELEYYYMLYAIEQEQSPVLAKSKANTGNGG